MCGKWLSVVEVKDSVPVYEVSQLIDPLLRMLLLHLAAIAAEFNNTQLVVTSAVRLDNPTSSHYPHPETGLGRAVDIRTYDWKPALLSLVINEIEKINKRLGQPIFHTKYHDAGYGVHLHINVNRFVVDRA